MLMSGTYTLFQVAKDLEEILTRTRNTSHAAQDTPTNPPAAQAETSEQDQPTS